MAGKPHFSGQKADFWWQQAATGCGELSVSGLGELAWQGVVAMHDRRTRPFEKGCLEATIMSYPHDARFPNSLQDCLNSQSFLNALRPMVAHCEVTDLDNVWGDVLLRLWTLCLSGRYRPECGTPFQLGCGVAFKVCQEHRRRRRELQLNDEIVYEVDDREPIGHILHKERSDALVKAIQGLSAEDRELIVLYYYVAPEIRGPISDRQRIRLCRLLKRLRLNREKFK